MFDFSMFDLTKGVSKEALMEQKQKLLENRNLDNATKTLLEGLNKFAIDKLFKDYDKDGNSFITTDEASLIEVDFSDDGEDSDKISKEDFLKMDFPNLKGADLEKIFAYLDTNDDEFISKAELENLTLEEIQNFTVPTEETTEQTQTEEVADNVVNDVPIADISNDYTPSNNYSSGGYSGSGSNTPTAKTPEEQIKELEGMRSEFQSKADQAIAQEETNLKQIIDQDEQLAELKEEYETESQRINEELTTANQQLTEAQNSLVDTEASITDKTNRIAYKTEHISNLETSISDKQSALNSISTSTGDPETDSANANKRAALQQEIDKLNDKLQQAKDDKSQLEQELQDLNVKKAELETTITELNEKIADLESQKDALLDKIAEAASPETKQAIEKTREKIEQIKTETQEFIKEINDKITEIKAQMSADSLNKEKAFDSVGSDIDTSQIKRFDKLTPEMQTAVIQLLSYAKENGLNVTVTSSYRSYEEQVNLYNTSRPGYAAKPGSSQHEFGKAIDIKIEGGDSDNKNDPKFKLLGDYWTSLGYNWGGTWSGANEPWHFDLRPA